MNDIFKTIEEYRNEFIDVLKKNKTHFDSKLTEYSTPSNNFKIKYYVFNFIWKILYFE